MTLGGIENSKYYKKDAIVKKSLDQLTSLEHDMLNLFYTSPVLQQ